MYYVLQTIYEYQGTQINEFKKFEPNVTREILTTFKTG